MAKTLPKGYLVGLLTLIAIKLACVVAWTLWQAAKDQRDP